MSDPLSITGSCPRCGAPIFSKERTENPKAVRTCPPACEYQRNSPDERRMMEAGGGDVPNF